MKIAAATVSAQEFFNSRLPAFLASSGDALNLDAVYVFRIVGEGGGVWTLDLKSTPPVCRTGPAQSTACEIEMSDSDFEVMLSNPEQSRDLFYENRIKVDGSIMLAAQIPKILTVLSGANSRQGLAALISPIPAGKFMRENWPMQSLTVHGSELPPAADVPELHDLNALLSAWKGMVRAGDKQGSLVDAKEARISYEQGLPLVFDQVERAIPSLQASLARLQWDLSLPANVLGRAIVYASPKGSVTPMHFDANINFVVQLRGEKQWQVAPNRNVANPLVQFMAGSPDVPPALRSYCAGPMPVAMPPETQTINLRRGAVLFVPRGWWHATLAIEDSLQLNFTFDQPAWVDVILPAIYRELIRHERWRELAHGAGAGSREAREAANQRLAELVERLAQDLAELDARQAIAELRPSTSDAYSTK